MTASTVMISGCITYTPRTWIEADFPTKSDCELGLAYLVAESPKFGEIINKPRCKKQKT